MISTISLLKNYCTSNNRFTFNYILIICCCCQNPIKWQTKNNNKMMLSKMAQNHWLNMEMTWNMEKSICYGQIPSLNLAE